MNTFLKLSVVGLIGMICLAILAYIGHLPSADDRLKEQQKQENLRQSNLTSCLNQAQNNYDNFLKLNGNVSLDGKTVYYDPSVGVVADKRLASDKSICLQRFK